MPSVAINNREKIPSPEIQWADHNRILEGYLDTHESRNHSAQTRRSEELFLTKWFAQQAPRERNAPLYVWEAMEPVRGRERVVAYVKRMVATTKLASSTIMGRMGMLRRFFEYVLEWPYIPDSGGISIQARYGPIEQPVLSYDYPCHAWHGRKEDAPLTRAELQIFYRALRQRVVEMANLGPRGRRASILGRNYTMFVVAAESGLRIHEVVALEIDRDLLFDSQRLQTRLGKGVNGSGPRVRQTVFTPFAQATVRHYIRQVRPAFKRWSNSPFLFLSEQGNPASRATANYAMKQLTKIGRDAKVRIPPRFGWHSLRRSFATTFMEEQPESPWVLMEMMGHANASTLHHYVYHPRAYHDQVMDAVIERLEMR